MQEFKLIDGWKDGRRDRAWLMLYLQRAYC
jgi:hypothetical protein